MNTLEQVEQLKQQAVELLLAERDRIDEQLAILQDEKAASQKKRGRKPKAMQEDLSLPAFHSNMTDVPASSPLS